MKPYFVGFLCLQQAEGICLEPGFRNPSLSVQTRYRADWIRKKDEFVSLPTNPFSFDEAKFLKQLHALAPSPNCSRARITRCVSVVGFVSDFNNTAVHMA
jgi:hypothetical protein